MSSKNNRAGVILVEVELQKPISHHRKVAVEVAWPDMLSLPLPGDTLQLDRMKVALTAGPADEETILDRPTSLKDYTWQGSYDSGEWTSAQTFASTVRKDPHVISARLIQ